MRDMIPDLDKLVIQYHPDSRLCITAFDSGSITPSIEERELGWSLADNVMVSPQLGEISYIPHAEYDEWYVFDRVPESIGGFECFVNYGSFNLADPRQMAASFDSTWERSGLDWLYPIQDRFWSQLDQLSPVTYVASGDCDIIVTQKFELVEYVHQLVQG